ncbi:MULTISPECIES: hypothetical protein [Bacillaceae]|uniref:hypothetical protein n=1 Tax=Bacillaceae TaxID=186817 RepID=UPI0012451E2F|nr:hypothetical protein [Robertmurraya sp. DFI.2.37]MDF1510687.1 hypothetical protein [Robertmurraya sp. DFI.2.37]
MKNYEIRHALSTIKNLTINLRIFIQENPHLFVSGNLNVATNLLTNIIPVQYLTKEYLSLFEDESKRKSEIWSLLLTHMFEVEQNFKILANRSEFEEQIQDICFLIHEVYEAINFIFDAELEMNKELKTLLLK